MDKKEARKIFQYGITLRDEGKHGKAIYCFERAVEMYATADDTVGEARSLREIGNVYSDLGKDRTARIYFLKTLEFYTKAKNLAGEGDALWRLGVLCEKHENHMEALGYYYRSQEKLQEAGDKKSLKKALSRIAYVLLELAHQYHESGKVIKAREYYQMSLKGFQHVKDMVGTGLALTGMGVVSEREKDYDQSLEYYKKALKGFKKAGDQERAETISSTIARIHKIQETPQDKN